MALILDCQVIASVQFDVVAGFVPDELPRTIRTFDPRGSLFIILKANLPEAHQVENWDKQLVLINYVHIVQGPQEWISSRIGLYDIEQDTTDCKVAIIVCLSPLPQVHH